jgi:hypothetical protein
LAADLDRVHTGEPSLADKDIDAEFILKREAESFALS